MEIYNYMPAKLLKKLPEEMDMDEFIETMAKAKYIQKIRALEVAEGISLVLGE